jgi:hypothetical protein
MKGISADEKAQAMKSEKIGTVPPVVGFLPKVNHKSGCW